MKIKNINSDNIEYDIEIFIPEEDKEKRIWIK